MSSRKLLDSIAAAGLLGFLAFVGASLMWTDSPQPGPSWANFDRLQIGMTLGEVERIMGPVGLSYSSDKQYQYYIIKGPYGWSRVWVREGKVTELRFDPIYTTEQESLFLKIRRWFGL
jgi:hypothetical protein